MIDSSTFPRVYTLEQPPTNTIIPFKKKTITAFAINPQVARLLGAEAKALRIDSFANYQQLVLKYDIEEDNDIQQLKSNLRAYFNNGGDTCFLMVAKNIGLEIQKHKEISLIVANGEDIEEVANLLTKENNLFALLDGPKAELSNNERNIPTGFKGNSCSAIYYPWLADKWTKAAIAPSAAIAGAYCKNDRMYGVWKSPANIALVGVDPIQLITDQQQGEFSQENAINMIRQFNHGPATLWGARTLGGADSFIPTQRLLMKVEQDIQSLLRTVLFEANSQATWSKIRDSIHSYCHALWQHGALIGSTEEDAFYIQVGENLTMSAEDIQQHKMIVKVGLATIRPAEYVELEFTQQMGF